MGYPPISKPLGKSKNFSYLLASSPFELGNKLEIHISIQVALPDSGTVNFL